MGTMDAVCAVAVFILAAASFAICYFQFHEKGSPFNNAYLFASKEERKTMDKKPYYRQSAIVFFCVGVIFSLAFIDTFLDANWLSCVIAIAAVVLLIYAIASSVTIAEKEE